MTAYKLSEEAKADLIRIYQWGVQQYGLARADSYFDKLIARFDDIALHPLAYPAVDFIRAGYRRSVCGVDSIYYRITEGDVEIMAILGRQDTNKLQKGS